MALSEAKIEQIKEYWSNHPDLSYQAVGDVYGIDNSTVWRIINTGSPHGKGAPFIDPDADNTGEAEENNETEVIPYTPPKRKLPRIGEVIAGSKNEGKEIMKRLDRLLQGQEARLDGFLEAEEDLLKELEGKDLDPLEFYKLAKARIMDYNKSIHDMKKTLGLMAAMSQSINTFVDNRKTINITYEQLPPRARERMDETITERIMNDMWPLMCQGCKDQFVALTNQQPLDDDEE